MFSLFDSDSHRPLGRSPRCNGIGRRELLRVGGIGGLASLNLSLPHLLQASSTSTEKAVADATFGKAKNILFLFLQGGPPQHETFDPKPDAPAEIRGEFKPIQTNVPGIHFCELLPRLAGMADKLAVVRSLCTHTDLHDASGYWILTGYPYKGQNSRQISNSDWPYFGSVLRQLKPSDTMPAYTSVWLPDLMRLNDNVQPAGQTGGFLGRRWDPQRIIGDPSAERFRVEGFALPQDIPPLRLANRERLLTQVDRHFARLEKTAMLQSYSQQVHEAFDVLTSGRAKAAFDLSKEPPALRDRYGRNKWGQCLLLGRRLIEAGVRLVHVNWPREAGDTAVDNPMWDTHAQNADRLQDVLCPQLDIGVSALLEDMEQRGLLAETLVVLIGEFGRTPRINGYGGRDHWGHVFSFALAGAGIQTAQVYGSSDHLGAYPKTGKMEPQDLTATMLHLLGVSHEAFFRDLSGRPLRATEGTPIWPLLGGEPATMERTRSTGDLAMSPPFNPEYLLNKNFSDDAPLRPIVGSPRQKGWKAEPITLADRPGFGVTLVKRPTRAARLGYWKSPATPLTIAAGAKAMLTQEIRNPRAGRFVVTVRALTHASSTEEYQTFWQNFICKLNVFGYADASKDPRRMREYAALMLQPALRAKSTQEAQEFKLSVVLRSQDGGAMELSRGVGLAITLEKTSAAPLSLVDGDRFAFIAVEHINVEFIPRPRNDDVVV